ncbi:GLABROUS1 enhancer-binding protein-like [Henckelia pumila]|uniref:GLABROUS1 enhancer-binding protein-like n=1 Tax=Henckelia pumila TaxID=405737 RepID=UPI003C6E1911
MAKNRQPEKPVESETESDDEGDEGSSEDGSSESDSEPEQGKSQFLKKPLPAPAAPKKTLLPTTPNPQPPSSSDDEESGSESDSEEPNREVKPLASKPMDSPQKSVAKPRSKPNAAGSSTPVKSTGAKRPAEEKEMEDKESKRSKKKPEPQSESSVKKSVEETKKQLFQRLWSQDDEIVVLEGMVEYAEKKRSDPVADLNAFHDFIKKNLHVDVTRAQLQDKIRRLKKKYVNNKIKEKKVGKDMTFSKPHEQKAYELSKIVWGSEKGKETGVEKAVGSPKANGNAARKNSNTNDNAVGDVHSKEGKCLEDENDEFNILGYKKSISSNETVEERILRVGAEFFEGDKKLEGAREWRKLRQEEVELHLKKLDLLRAQTKLVLDVLKSTN